MKYTIYFIIIILLVGLNVGLFKYIPFFGAVSNLLLLFVVGVSLQREAEESLFIAFISGIFLDYYNGLFIGSFAISFLSVSIIIYFFIHQLVVFELSWRYLFTIVTLSTIFTACLVWALNVLAIHFNFPAAFIDTSELHFHLMAEVIYNLLLAYPLYLLATYLKNFFLNLQGRAHRII